MNDIEKLNFVQAQLSTYSGESRHTGKGIFILCPFHSEKTPSGLIYLNSTRNPGFFKCFGCGTKKHWDEIAPLIGLQPYGYSKPTVYYSHTKLSDTEEAKNTKFELKELPEGKIWREIKTDLLIDIGCKLLITEYKSKFVFLPVYVNGKLKGYSKGRLRKEKGQISYINKNGSWTKTYGLFPFDYSINLMLSTKDKTIVLVEGQRDALRLLMNGIPALAILGTNSWSKKKVELLELHGVEKIILMMDGDPEGIRATKTALDLLKPFFKVSIVKLWKLEGKLFTKYLSIEDKEKQKIFKSKLWDPGNCPQWIISKLKKNVYG